MGDADKKVTIRKYNGDDQYSWAVFTDGRIAHPSLTGLNRSQARYYRDQVKARLGQQVLTAVSDG